MLRYRLFMNTPFLKEVKEGKGRKPEERAEKNDWEALIFFLTREGQGVSIMLPYGNSMNIH